MEAKKINSSLNDLSLVISALANEVSVLFAHRHFERLLFLV